MRRKSSGFGPSLVELVVAIAIFALAAAMCVKIFAWSSRLAGRSEALSHAVILAESAAECFKATSDLEETAALLGGAGGSEGFTLCFDADLALAVREDEAAYILSAEPRQGDIPLCRVTVSTPEHGELFALTAAGRGAAE